MINKYLKRKLIYWQTIIISVAVIFIGLSSLYLYQDKRNNENDWMRHLEEACDYSGEEKRLMENAVQMSVGTYIESIDKIDIRNSQYSVTFNCWFNWQGRDELDMTDNFFIYEGNITDAKKIDEYRKDQKNYQLFKVNATVHKEFDTRRFPLGSYQLRLYIMPSKTIEDIVFIPDENSSAVNENLSVTGFKLSRHAVGSYINRCGASSYGAYHKNGMQTYSEVLTEIELKRSSWGLYLKCILVLLGTAVWMMITLFACSHHKVDTMGMIPAVFIGTATNIMVGADLVPDALHAGLLEFINIWGIYTIILVTIIVMHINKMRRCCNTDADLFGKVMFYTVLITTIAGHIILPLAAYSFL